MESVGRSDARPLTGEEEAIKRNTDCVYFLASPLTCKKGSECEYRHSEGARVNPRDCKFWFSGNCMNPKCLFRHPPLDGLVGNPVVSSGPITTPLQVAASMHLPTPNSSVYNSNRNSVPCYYFQMGTCLKGDKCPFMHFPQPAPNPGARQTPKVLAPVNTQLDSHKKESWKIKEVHQQSLSNTPSLTVKPEPSTAKVNMAPETSSSQHKKSLLPVPTRNGLVTGSTFSQPRASHAQSDKNLLNDREAGEILEEPSGIDYAELNWPLKHQLQPYQYKNDKWAEEVIRESSPGFDVLVDNVVSDCDYLHEQDGFKSGSVRGVRNLDHHSGHDSSATLDRDRGDLRGTSSISGRILDKPVLPVRRLARKLGSPDGMDKSDLRHRLMKHRRLNGSSSATISGRESEPYSRHEPKMPDRHTRNSYRDQRQLLPENNVSSRLRGRVRLPKLSSPEFTSDLQDGGWGRHRGRGRLSPVRPSSLHGRLGERLRRKSIEERQVLDPLSFAGPRSLAELKGAKADGNSETVRSISSPEHNGMKSFKVDSEVSVSFDGPKPLSVLLKSRVGTPPNDAISSVNGVMEAPGEIEVRHLVPKAVSDPEIQSQHVLETRLEDNKAAVEDEVYIPSEVDVNEERDAGEDDDVDYTDQREGEYEYVAIESRDYKEEDDENLDPMNVDLDDDEDEDDFAKKIGLIFS